MCARAPPTYDHEMAKRGGEHSNIDRLFDELDKRHFGGRLRKAGWRVEVRDLDRPEYKDHCGYILTGW